MRLIEQHHLVEYITVDPLTAIEQVGRTCWRSEEKAGPGTAARFVKMVIKKGHTGLLEHVHMRVRCWTNRGVSHELVRHRLASYAQQSTRYVGEIDGHIEFIRPVWWNEWNKDLQKAFTWTLNGLEDAYKQLLESGASRDQAREILPNATATEIVITANLREWRESIFPLRALGTTGKPHPQMQALAQGILDDAKQRVPVVFDDLQFAPRQPSRRQKADPLQPSTFNPQPPPQETTP